MKSIRLARSGVGKACGLYTKRCRFQWVSHRVGAGRLLCCRAATARGADIRANSRISSLCHAHGSAATESQRLRRALLGTGNLEHAERIDERQELARAHIAVRSTNREGMTSRAHHRRGEAL